MLGGASSPLKKPEKPAKPRPKTKAPPDPEIDAKKLRTDKQREKALDTIGLWFVAALLSAADDRKRATAVITKAIRLFYDVRESADQERGEYAGHFFMVDAVGLESSDRPVPWTALEKKASASELALWQKLFDVTESKVR